MIITSMDRPDIIQVRDLITNKLWMAHISRLRVSRHPKEMSWGSGSDGLDEFHVESIVDHNGEDNNP